MEPTNQDILNTIVEHTKNDETFQDETRLVQAHQASASAETDGKLAALELKIDGVATKEDIKEVLQFMKSLKVGEGILKFTWDNAAKIGGIAIFLIAIGVFFKGGLMAAVAFITGNKL